MALSNDIVSQFAKLVKPEDTRSKSATLNGTYKNIDGVEYVQLDGSDVLTPVTSMVEAETGERVKVEIKDHNATVTGNISSPMARSKSVNDIKDEVDEFGNSIKQMDNTIQQQNNSIQQMDNAIKEVGDTINSFQNTIDIQNNTIQQFDNTIKQQNDRIDSMDNDIKSWGNTIDSMNNTITEQGDNIKSMNNTITEMNNTIDQQNNTIEQYGNQIEQFGSTIEQMNTTVEQHDTLIQQHDSSIRQAETDIDTLRSTVTVHDSDITILNSAFTIKDGVLEGLDKAIIDALITNNLNTVYAKIDFTNIGIAAIEKLFTDSGIIGDLVVKDQHITGKLVGVTIIGDLIEAGTIKADKLVVQGEDGLYYKLNVSGETVEAKQTEYNSLSGTVITAHSITAEKITVEDLVAFGATIGGFDITKDSIHSHAKAAINSDANGLYFDNSGQLYVGDLNNHVKYYKKTDEEGQESWILDITASQLFLGGSTTSVNDTLTAQEQTNQQLDSKINDSVNELNGTIQDTKEELNGSIESTETNLTNSMNDMNQRLSDEDSRMMELIQANAKQIDINAQQVNLTFKQTGGNNLLRNSVGYSTSTTESGGFILDFWTTKGTVSTEQDDAMSLSGSCIVLKSGASIEQDFSAVVGTKYAIAFSLQHIVDGTAENLKVEIIDGSETFTVFEGTTSYATWHHISLDENHPYVANTNKPKIKITAGTGTGTDTYKITDLIVANGEAEVWSPYFDEVYGKQHRLDQEGLRLYNMQDKDYSQMTSTNMLIKHDNKVVGELSQNRVYSNRGEFVSSYTVGRLTTIVLDNDNIIETINES